MGVQKAEDIEAKVVKAFSLHRSRFYKALPGKKKQFISKMVLLAQIQHVDCEWYPFPKNWRNDDLSR